MPVISHLPLLRILYALTFVWAMVASPAAAHEIQPSVADLTAEEGQVTLDIRMTLEAAVAGVDLQGLEDTDASDRAEDYDAARALDPAALEAALRAAWPDLSTKLRVEADGAPVALDIAGVEIPEVGEVDLPRFSTLSLAGTLPGGAETVTVGWTADLGDLVIRQIVDGEVGYTAYLSGGERTDPVDVGQATATDPVTVFVDYVVIGFEHIIPKGLDHILFVLGLFFLSARLVPLLWQVTAFTLAHTVTLALGILGLVNVPAEIVEPLIAASIVYVGVENVLSRGLTPWRPVVVFLFGLLHGLGFASVLGDIGLDPGQFAISLIGFNIGVEVGQLAVIAIAFALVGYWFGGKDWYRARIATPASLAIAAVGAYWAIERTLL
ncbi:MAG: HupE/UreJ family protein [Pseudomonadota bacterium]